MAVEYSRMFVSVSSFELNLHQYTTQWHTHHSPYVINLTIWEVNVFNKSISQNR